MIHEKWPFSRALLFSVSALSTGGLVAPSTDESAMWFTGVYTLFGVPLYGYVLASVAGFLETRSRLAIKRKEILHGFSERDRGMLHDLHMIDETNTRGIDRCNFLTLYDRQTFFLIFFNFLILFIFFYFLIYTIYSNIFISLPFYIIFFFSNFLKFETFQTYVRHEKKRIRKQACLC